MIFYRSHLSEKVATLTGKTVEPKFQRRVKRIELTVEGSNSFLRGFKNIFLSLYIISFSTLGQYLASIQLGEKILSCLLNGLVTSLEEILYYIFQLEYIFVNTQKILLFFCRGKLDCMITSEGIVDIGRRWLECLVHDLELNIYHFSLIDVF